MAQGDWRDVTFAGDPEFFINEDDIVALVPLKAHGRAFAVRYDLTRFPVLLDGPAYAWTFVGPGADGTMADVMIAAWLDAKLEEAAPITRRIA